MRDPEAVVDAAPIIAREASADGFVAKALGRDQLDERRRDVDLTACRIVEQQPLSDAMPREDEGDGVALVERRRLFDVVAVGMVADDEEDAVGELFLRRADEGGELPRGVPVVAELLQESFVVLRFLRQSRADFFCGKALGGEVDRVGRMVRDVEEHMKPGLFWIGARKNLAVENLVVHAPDATFIGLEVAAAVDVGEALRAAEGLDALPRRRPRVPEARIVAETGENGRDGGRIGCAEGFGHGRQVEIGIGEARDDAREGGDGTRAVRQKGITVNGIIGAQDFLHRIGDAERGVLFQQRPVRVAFGDDEEDVARLLDLRALRLLREVDVEVERVGGAPGMERGEALDFFDGEVQPVAREKAIVQRVGAVERLKIVEDRFIEEGIVRDAGIFPVDGVLPAQTAAEDGQEGGEDEECEKEDARK